MNDNTEQARGHFMEGVALLQAGRLPEAEAAFEASLALVPGRPSTLTNLGCARVRLGKAAEGQMVLEQALKAEPDNFEAWYNLGLAHKAQGRLDRALECLDKALALHDAAAVVWLYRGQVLSLLGRADDALASFDKGIAIQPDFAQAWSDRGTLLRDMDRPGDAMASFEKAVSLGADAALNQWFVSALDGGAAAPGAPARAQMEYAPRAYVERLFDDYAPDFQRHVVDVLAYRGHRTLVDHLLQMRPGRFESVLDLGCGTGLCGQLVEHVSRRIDGVDLSARMLKEAGLLRTYKQLVHADVVEYLQEAQRRDDLVLAADVFIYVGALDKVFEGVARILAPGGYFCFTIEPTPGGEDVKLMPNLRYAHSEAYVRRLADSRGLVVDKVFRAPLRDEEGTTVEGLYFYLTQGAPPVH